MNIFIDIALSIDRTIYTWIPKIYDLIIRLASYEIFSADTINGLSRRIYALLGIFMLFKLSFSMVSYIVNPDDFSDKSKGFGGLIKNVIISMVMIVAVPYIFAEAFYVQKMILDDGTIVKLIFAEGGAGDELNTDSSSVTYVNGGAGEEISFILFNQFVKPNDAIKAIKDDCRRIYKIGDDGKRVTDGSGTYELDETCDAALKTAFNGADNEYQHYIDAMKYQNYKILVNNPEIFKAEYGENLVLNQDGSVSASKTSVKVIKYNWILSFIFGLVTLLFLVTLCIDVATRTIKLAFYQIIAPVPIISNCDPKAKKDGMFNKWIKACVSTYLDLFIRLVMFYLAIFIIKSFADKFFTSHNESGVALFIVLGALVFAKQAPKIVEDLTGLKMEKFTLNPFKKISNEALLPEKVGKAIGKIGLGTLTGAAGGALAGAIGGGNSFGTRLFSAGAGALRGGMKSDGFGAGLSAQADSNRKMREARIAGASFWGGVGAGVGSVFGLDKAHLEKESTRIRSNKDAIDKAYRTKIEPESNRLKTEKKSFQDKIASKKKRRGLIDANKSVNNNMMDLALKNVQEDGGKGGELFKKLQADKGNIEKIKNGTGIWRKGTSESMRFSDSVDDQQQLTAFLGTVGNQTEIVFNSKTNQEELRVKGTGEVLASRWTDKSYANAETTLSNDQENAKLDYTTGMVKIIEAKKAWVEAGNDADSFKVDPNAKFVGEDGEEHYLTDINDGKIDLTFETAYEKKLMNDKQLKESYDSVVQVGGEYYYVNEQGEREQLTGREKEYYEKYIINELDLAESDMGIGKQIKARGGAAKGTVEIMGAELDPYEAEIARIDDRIVHLETTTIVDGLVDEHGHAVTGENATYSKAKDQNAKDKADQDARIAQSDVMHKGYDASKLTK